MAKTYSKLKPGGIKRAVKLTSEELAKRAEKRKSAKKKSTTKAWRERIAEARRK